jgi:hypothetical protein
MIIFGVMQSLRTHDEALEIRRTENGSLLQKLKVNGYTRDIATDVDGRLLFAAIKSDSGDGVRVWRTSDWSELRFVSMDGVQSLWPLVDPDLLGVYDLNLTFRIWRISTGTEAHRFSHTSTAKGVTVASAADRASHLARQLPACLGYP